MYNLIEVAKSVGKRMANEYISYGDYKPIESWGSEGQIYPSLTGIALLNLYRKTSEVIYLEGVKAIIQSNFKKRIDGGGWPLLLAAMGDGIKFNVPQELKDLTKDVNDLPPTVTAIRLIAEYTITTKDHAYLQVLKELGEFLLKYWNEEEGSFDEMMTNKVIKLRANPKSYLIYAFQCVQSLSALFPEYEVYLNPMYKTIKSVFEGFDAYTYPLLYAMHACLIIKEEPESEYTRKLVHDKIKDEIVFNSKFLIEDVPGALGHYDGLRGFCNTEGHLRNSIGAAMVLSIYDKYVEGGTFTKTALYKEVSDWIQSMNSGDFYYEYQDFESGEKRGVGSGGQYLPIFWILGEF